MDAEVHAARGAELHPGVVGHLERDQRADRPQPRLERQPGHRRHRPVRVQRPLDRPLTAPPASPSTAPPVAEAGGQPGDAVSLTSPTAGQSFAEATGARLASDLRRHRRRVPDRRQPGRHRHHVAVQRQRPSARATPPANAFDKGNPTAPRQPGRVPGRRQRGRANRQPPSALVLRRRRITVAAPPTPTSVPRVEFLVDGILVATDTRPLHRQRHRPTTATPPRVDGASRPAPPPRRGLHGKAAARSTTPSPAPPATSTRCGRPRSTPRWPTPPAAPSAPRCGWSAASTAVWMDRIAPSTRPTSPRAGGTDHLRRRYPGRRQRRRAAGHPDRGLRPAQPRLRGAGLQRRAAHRPERARPLPDRVHRPDPLDPVQPAYANLRIVTHHRARLAAQPGHQRERAQASPCCTRPSRPAPTSTASATRSTSCTRSRTSTPTSTSPTRAGSAGPTTSTARSTCSADAQRARACAGYDKSTGSSPTRPTTRRWRSRTCPTRTCRWAAADPVGPFYELNPRFDERDFATNLQAVRRGRAAPSCGMLIDTSRNGWGGAGPHGGVRRRPTSTPMSTSPRSTGAPTAAAGATRPGPGLGIRPTASTGTPGIDAFVWVKPPGESDGVTQADRRPRRPGQGLRRDVRPQRHQPLQLCLPDQRRRGAARRALVPGAVHDAGAERLPGGAQPLSRRLTAGVSPPRSTLAAVRGPTRGAP